MLFSLHNRIKSMKSQRKRFIVELFPLPEKGCKLMAYAWCLWLLGQEGSLLCHNSCDIRPRSCSLIQKTARLVTNSNKQGVTVGLFWEDPQRTAYVSLCKLRGQLGVKHDWSFISHLSSVEATTSNRLWNGNIKLY